MNKKIMKRLMCLMVLIALAGGLIIMPVKVMATVVTPDETEQTEETEQAKSPITPTNEVMNETEDAAEGVTAETPEISGITIESDNDDEEDETKPAYTLKAKIKVSAAAKTMSDAEVVVGEQEPDGKVYVKATAYVNQGELRDAIGAGSIKISKKLESSDGTWKPTPGQNYVVAIRGYSRVYNESGQYKWGTTGYKKTYKISAAKRRAQKKREAKKRRLTLRRKNQKNRLIYQSTNYYFDEGEAYSIPELMLSGYTMTAESKAKLTGTMGSEDTTVDLAYEGDEVPINIAYVDYSGDAVADAYSSTGIVGESYSVDSPTVDGYKLDNDYYGTISGTVTAGGVNQKIYYSEEKYWLVINHLDENGNELYPQADSYELKPGTEYSYDDTTSSGPIRSFDGYTLVDGDFTTEEVDNGDGTKTTKKVIKGTMPKEKKELTLNYVHKKEVAQLNFTCVGLTEDTAAPAEMPTEPVLRTTDSEDDITYTPPVIEGWTLVGSAGYASEWYDARKNLVTIPANNYLMRASSEDKPYAITYTYKQQVKRTVSFKYDDPAKTEEAAPSQTYTILAGEKMNVDNPLIEGYICSKGKSTQLVATGGSDVVTYYTPYTNENGWKVVEGIPGDVQFDTSNWNPERPDDPYKATLTFAWSSNIDVDSESVWSTIGSYETKVFIDGAYVGDLDQYNNYSFFTDDKYFKEHHNEFQVTLYQQRSKNAYYGYENDVYVKTEFTLHLPENPIAAETDKDSLYKVVPVTATVTPANEDTYFNTEKTFGLTFEAGSNFDEINLAWSITKNDVESLGATAINKNHHVLFVTSDGDDFVLERNGLKGTSDFSIQAGSIESNVTVNDNGGANYTLPNVPLGYITGAITLDGWYCVGNGWIHVSGSIDRPTGEITAEKNTDIVATSCEYAGYGRRDDYSEGAYQWDIEWSDSSNSYKVREILSDPDATFSNGQKEAKYYESQGYSDFGARIVDTTYACNNYKYNATVPVYADDGALVGYLSPEKVGKNTQTGFEYDYPHINSDTGACTYKGTVFISNENYKKYKGKTLHFTRRNTAIGVVSGDAGTTESKDAAGNVLYTYTYHNGDICRYTKDSTDEYDYSYVLKNSTSTISFTLSDTGSETIYDVKDCNATIDTANSSLTKDNKFTIVMNNVDQIVADAWTDNVYAKQKCKVYMCNCDDDATAMPVYSEDVFGQGWATCSPDFDETDGTKLTLSGTFNHGSELESLIPGGKYKVAVLMDGYQWIGGTEENGYKNNAQYYKAEATATLTVPSPDTTTISRSLDSLTITSAKVERTYEDPQTGELYPQLSLAWSTQFSGTALSESDMKVYSRQRYEYYGGSEDVQVIVSIYDKETDEDIDYYTSGDDSTQRQFTITPEGGTYQCWFVGSGTDKYRVKLSNAYEVAVKYKYKTSDKYGNTVWKTKTYCTEVKRETGKFTKDVTLQVDNTGSSLVRLVSDEKLNTPKATIWYDGKKYDELTLTSEATDGDYNYKNWYAWVDLGDGDGNALDVSKLKATISCTDYDSNTYDETKEYKAEKKDFVTITKAKEKNGTFNLAYKMAIPNSSFRAVSTYWTIEGKSDVEEDNGAVVVTEEQKIGIYSGDVVYEGSAYKDSETGLYFGKFKSLDGKKVNVKVYNHNKDVVFTSSAVIGSEGATTATDDVVVTSATYDINGNLTLAGTYDNEAVTIKSWNNYYMYVEGADGESYTTSLSESSDGVNGFVVDKDAETFSYTGKAFTPSGNSIFGYTLREFAGLSDKNLKVSVALNGTESDQAAFTYTDGALTVSDSMIKEVTEDGADYLQVSLPRGYYANTVDIGGVIATAKEGSKGLKFASAEDDVEFTFDAATVTSMTGEGDALLSVSKYTGTMPANVTTSGLKAMAAYELGFSWSYTGNMKVRLTSEAELTEGGVPTVYYVSSDGTATEEMATTYSINQYDEVEAVFTSPHNSTFVVVYKGQTDAEDYANITFDANGGTGTMDPQVVVKGDAIELKANTFTRDGFTFAGWGESADATEVKYADKATATFDADITLYAVWKESGSGNNEQGGGSGQNEQGGGSGQNEQGGGSGQNEQGGGSGQNEQGGGSGQSGQSGDSGQTTTPITETPAAPAVTGSTVSDATSGAEYVVTTEAGSKQTVEYKVPTVAMTQTIIVIPATVVVNGTQYEVTSIADKAFKDNTTVTSITIGENVETIGESAFEGCTSLTSITIPASVTTVGDSAFEGCTKLKTATMAKGVTEIGTKAFANCTSLTKVSVPSTVTKIGDQAFSGDKKLKSATIGNNVTEIGDKAFANCSSLTSITIPKKVNKLGANVFKGDKKLKTITVKTTKLNSKNVSKNAFKGISNKTVIKVPKSKKKAYTTLFRKKGLSKKVKIK